LQHFNHEEATMLDAGPGIGSTNRLLEEAMAVNSGKSWRRSSIMALNGSSLVEIRGRGW
jgi:hypothetical protein